MEFINKVADSQNEKRLCAYIISNLIPELDTISFKEIDKMLKIVGKGLKEYRDNDANLESKFLEDLRLKLKSQNIQ